MVEDILIRNLTTNEELELSMESTPFYILSSVDWGSISTNHFTYKFVNQIGETVTGTTLGTRDITIIGYIIADIKPEMTQRKKFLNKLINPLHLFQIEYKDYILEFVLNETIKYATEEKDNNEIICKFQIVGTCTNPLFISKKETLEEVAIMEPVFHFPLILSDTPDPPGGVIFGEKLPVSSVLIVNEGDVETGMTIVLTALAEVSDIAIVNVNTQERFEINKTLQIGEKIIIVTESGKKSITGIINNESLNYYSYKTYDSKWLQLYVGDNIIAYEASDARNLEVMIYHTDKWLEVQECN